MVGADASDVNPMACSRLTPQLSVGAGMRIIDGMDASTRAPGPPPDGLAEWFATPLGRYLLEREQAQFDRTVADIFGFHAIHSLVRPIAAMRTSFVTSSPSDVFSTTVVV